jgi:spore coat polysaccharide biosynthesis protein SpsF
MKIVGIIQARMGSSRLPGKVLMPILGKPMLGHVMERLGRCSTITEVVIATTTDPRDRVLCEFAEKNGYLCGVGPEEDVLGRYYKVAKKRGADVVLRLTSDCPLIDPGTTDAVVRRHLAAGNNDMTSNVFTRTYPRGLDTEALSMECLERVNREALDPVYREHVTNFIHDHPEQFKIESIEEPEDHSRHRWCVDTEEDLELVRRIYEGLYPGNAAFGWRDVLRFVESRPGLETVNAHVRQSKIFKRKTRA